MILLTEYRANSIRLRRVLLLRSDIRLTPSYICYASLGRIEYHRSRKASISLSLCDNITLCVSKEYHFIPTEKEIAFRRTTDLLSLSLCIWVPRNEVFEGECVLIWSKLIAISPFCCLCIFLSDYRPHMLALC